MQLFFEWKHENATCNMQHATNIMVFEICLFLISVDSFLLIS